MTKKKDPRVLLSVPVDAARVLYTILEYAPVVEKALDQERTNSGITFRKFSKNERKLLLELYDDLAFKLSVELFE